MADKFCVLMFGGFLLMTLYADLGSALVECPASELNPEAARCARTHLGLLGVDASHFATLNANNMYSYIGDEHFCTKPNAASNFAQCVIESQKKCVLRHNNNDANSARVLPELSAVRKAVLYLCDQWENVLNGSNTKELDSCMKKKTPLLKACEFKYMKDHYGAGVDLQDGHCAIGKMSAHCMNLMDQCVDGNTQLFTKFHNILYHIDGCYRSGGTNISAMVLVVVVSLMAAIFLG